MLENLPVEVLQCIIGHLSTASSIANLALTSRKLHSTVSADDYAIFRTFVQAQFPSIKAKPPWRNAAIELTSRSRAWDRRALIARECRPPDYGISHDHNQRNRNPNNAAYVPVIDSYENTSSQQVLAWGAAGRVMVRIHDRAGSKWAIWKYRDDDLASNDVLNLQLLRPHQREAEMSETAIVQRAETGVVKLDINPSTGFCELQSTFNASADINCTDTSQAIDPLLAVCYSTSMQIFRVRDSPHRVDAAATVNFDHDFTHRHRYRCAKFLSDNKIALGVQFLDGREQAPILVYDIGHQGSSIDINTSCKSYDVLPKVRTGRLSTIVIAPLGKTTGSDGTLFLAGWTDGIVRLHDIRTPENVVMRYWDPVDDGQILSILPIGHEKFLASSHQNAVLKTFDMRMPRANSYSYLEHRAYSQTPSNVKATAPSSPPSRHQRDFNIFLGVHQHHRRTLWQPLPIVPRKQKDQNKFPRYQGPVYSLSAPSATSPTVFAGIQNAVLQLDFISTDDFRRKIVDAVPSLLHTPTERVLDLSVYDRPRLTHTSTDPVLLRKQVDWLETLRSSPSESDTGWDERWSLSTANRVGNRRGSWSRWRQR